MGNIERAVRGAAATVSPLVGGYEIVDDDDCSRDRTGSILESLTREMEPRLEVVRRPINRGYGAALRDGFQATRGELVFYTDCDRGGGRYVQRGVRHYPRTAGRSTVKSSDAPRTLTSIARMWLRLRAERLSRVAA